MEASRTRGWPPIAMLAYRRGQLDLMIERIGPDRFRGRTVLEIGGGASGQGVILSGVAGRVISSDLLAPTAAHARPLTELPRFGVEIISARAEQLPLRDGSVDIVFSSYVLEHVSDRPRAVGEIARVLRPGGIVVSLVPNVPSTLLVWVWYWLIYFPRQGAKWFLAGTRLDRRMFRRTAHPDFHWRPHGEYAGVVDELRHSTIARWDALFAGFKIVDRFAISHESYVCSWSFSVLSATQRLARPLLRWLARTRIGLLTGPGYVLVAEKR